MEKPTHQKVIKEEYKPNAGVFAIGMTKKEIKVLVYWACIGVARSKGGMYENVVPKMLSYFAKQIKIKLPYKPEFNAKIKSYKKKTVKLLKDNHANKPRKGDTRSVY